MLKVIIFNIIKLKLQKIKKQKFYLWLDFKLDYGGCKPSELFKETSYNDDVFQENKSLKKGK